MSRQSIAELSNGAAAARLSQRDVGCAYGVGMRIGDDNAASRESQAVDVVDVVVNLTYRSDRTTVDAVRGRRLRAKADLK